MVIRGRKVTDLKDIADLDQMVTDIFKKQKHPLILETFYSLLGVI